jgi:hypothetical protein
MLVVIQFNSKIQGPYNIKKALSGALRDGKMV